MFKFFLRWICLAIAVDYVIPYGSFADYKLMVPCDKPYQPDFCDLPRIRLSKMNTVEDFDRCGPAALSIPVRNFFWGAAGRKVSYNWNIDAYESIQILPRVLRDESSMDLSTTVLGRKISMPIGIASVAAPEFAHPLGTIALSRAAAKLGTVMILSSLASHLLEDVAAAAYETTLGAQKQPVLWMQLYLLNNRSDSLQIARRAQRAGFLAIVLTVDVPRFAKLTCDAGKLYSQAKIVNFHAGNSALSNVDLSETFDDITWLKKRTSLPIVAKGILAGDDAVRAVKAGASAIYVSNHGGRMMDYAPATIDVLSEVVDALADYPDVEVYVDGGVRNGWAVFKAIARGARAVFIGRPQIWGLAIGAERGVTKVLSILREEFNETMMAAGVRDISEIDKSFISP